MLCTHRAVKPYCICALAQASAMKNAVKPLSKKHALAVLDRPAITHGKPVHIVPRFIFEPLLLSRNLMKAISSDFRINFLSSLCTAYIYVSRYLITAHRGRKKQKGQKETPCFAVVVSTLKNISRTRIARRCGIKHFICFKNPLVSSSRENFYCSGNLFSTSHFERRT